MRRRFLNNIEAVDIEPEKNYFYVQALEDNCIAYLTNAQCSTNGIDWVRSTSSISIKKGKKLYFKGNTTPSSSSGIGTFSINKKCDIGGNILSLLYDENFEGLNKIADKTYAFYKLFYNCSNIVNANKLELPAIVLSNYCYAYMFYGCSNLETYPLLPATTLANYCYTYMFYGCSKLITAPDLIASQVYDYSYNNMFYGCTSLIKIPSITAATLGSYSCYRMFSNCTSLVDASTLLISCDTVGEYSCQYMFYGCTNLTRVPRTLNPLRISAGCYSHMFYGCTSLTIMPQLPATTLYNNCYAYMFYGCTSLIFVPIDLLPATTLANYCYTYMFYRCTRLEEAPDLPATRLADVCYESMFMYCTNLGYSPDLMAEELTQNCYSYMFAGCTELHTITMLATSMPYTNSLLQWVNSVSRSGSFYKNSRISEREFSRGTSGIPENWDVYDF